MSFLYSSHSSFDSKASYDIALPDKEGWMYKRGMVVKNWKRRYFILKEHVVYYYDNEKSRKPKGKILLEFESVAKNDKSYLSNHKGPSNVSPDNLIVLSTSNREWFLLPESSEEVNEWIVALQKASRVAPMVSKTENASKAKIEEWDATASARRSINLQMQNIPTVHVGKHMDGILKFFKEHNLDLAEHNIYDLAKLLKEKNVYLLEEWSSWVEYRPRGQYSVMSYAWQMKLGEVLAHASFFEYVWWDVVCVDQRASRYDEPKPKTTAELLAMPISSSSDCNPPMRLPRYFKQQQLDFSMIASVMWFAEYFFLIGDLSLSRGWCLWELSWRDNHETTVVFRPRPAEALEFRKAMFLVDEDRQRLKEEILIRFNNSFQKFHEVISGLCESAMDEDFQFYGKTLDQLTFGGGVDAMKKEIAEKYSKL